MEAAVLPQLSSVETVLILILLTCRAPASLSAEFFKALQCKVCTILRKVASFAMHGHTHACSAANAVDEHYLGYRYHQVIL